MNRTIASRGACGSFLWGCVLSICVLWAANAFGDAIRLECQPPGIVLCVKSTPITGVCISGDKPGATNYTAACSRGQTVRLTAPSSVTKNNLQYSFVRWVVGCTNKPAGETSVQVKMDASSTVTAVYEQVVAKARLAVKGPADRGENPSLQGGGAFSVDVYVSNVRGLAGLQATLRFLDGSGRDAGFLIAPDPTNELFGGLAIQFNSSVCPSFFPVYTGDRRCFGFMAMSGTIDITQETRLFTVTYEYGSSASGTYTIGMDPGTTSLGGSNREIAWEDVTGRIIIAPGRTLTVASAPITGLPIAGDKPGTTDYTALCASGQTVGLTAPATASAGGVSYKFANWLVDGLPRAVGQTTLSLTMNAAHAATAVYQKVAARIVVKGPVELGAAPSPEGGGTFIVDVFVGDVASLAGMQVLLKFIDDQGRDAAFTISEAGGDPDFGGLAIRFNTALTSNFFPVYSADRRCFGFISLNGVRAIQQETLAFSVTYEYDASARGNYTIAADPALTLLASSSARIPFRAMPGGLTIGPAIPLVVESSPIDGVMIAGDKPGQTPYAAQC
ncbi:MAG TPA: hypothetical protein VM487_01215, partial [Phycisphaerae bacterium]|nr:hypothetical protein [Phycisphaerae bacterium]